MKKVCYVKHFKVVFYYLTKTIMNIYAEQNIKKNQSKYNLHLKIMNKYKF